MEILLATFLSTRAKERWRPNYMNEARASGMHEPSGLSVVQRARKQSKPPVLYFSYCLQE